MSAGNREAAIGRIRALLAKTVANGCSEEEALAAAAKAGELMDRYSVTMTDVEIRQAACETRAGTERSHPVEGASDGIARFCGCKVWKEGGALRYFGLPHDVAVAAYLTDLCRTAMDAAFRRFLASPRRPRHIHGRRLRSGFMTGMAARLQQRLHVMASERERTARTSSGTALVVVRGAVVEEQFERLGFRLKKGRESRAHFDAFARVAGFRAGDGVALTTGIGRDGRLQIEGAGI